MFSDRHGRSWWSPYAAEPERTRGEGGGAVRLLPHRGAYSFAAVPTDETIWYAAGPNVYRVALSDSATAILRDSVVAVGRVGAMMATRDGSLWAVVKMDDLRFKLIRVRDGRVTTYTEKDGLPKTALRAVLADDDGTVWLGTYGSGLVRFRDGQFRTLTEENGLGDNVVTSLLEDAAGNLWMGGNRSVHRVARRELEAFFAGTLRRVRGATYGRDDGLISPETVGFPGVRDRAGRFWFPTIAGAAVVDPVAALELDRGPPRVHVLELRTTRDTVAGADAGHSLTRGARRLTLSYTATAMRNPKAVRYEYRLDGVDDDWIYAGSSREATYNNVGPGTHTFRVRAINGGGVLSASDATLQFIVPPLFHETAAFYALLLLLAVSLGWMALRFRERGSRLRELALQRAVDERTARLATALQTVAEQADKLRALDEAKSRFFANVSHEFRTPLSLIVGPVEDLRDGRWGELSASVRGRLEGVLANSRRLLKLVEQLLDIARLESGTLQLSAEVRDLVPLLRRMTDSFASLAERRGIAFRLSCPVGGLRVRYDPDHMEKVIGNLVGNALKFTPNGGSVELRARTETNGDGTVVIEVQDTGPGIAPEFHARVFERFFQVDDSSRRAHEGTGIGLALVRELVVLHGGSVSLESALGQGS
ncbi:MAG: ATP-binding protein, partial [Gemmatimonadaceae bacterium]